MPLLLIMQLLLKFAKNKKDIKRIRVKTRIVFITMVFNIYVYGAVKYADQIIMTKLLLFETRQLPSIESINMHSKITTKQEFVHPIF